MALADFLGGDSITVNEKLLNSKGFINQPRDRIDIAEVGRAHRKFKIHEESTPELFIIGCKICGANLTNPPSRG
ncbi:MAG: hypothetical protein WB676_27460 [Bryobacteraceae bacterium]